MILKELEIFEINSDQHCHMVRTKHFKQPNKLRNYAKMFMLSVCTNRVNTSLNGQEGIVFVLPFYHSITRCPAKYLVHLNSSKM